MGGRSGQIAIKPVCGPLANKVEDCELMMRAFCQPAMWQMDSSVPPCPWDVSVAAAGNGKPLRIGYFTTDGWFEPCRSMTRAVHEAVVALEHAGHTVVPVTLPHSGWDVATSYYGIMGATGNMYDFIKGLEGENIHPLYRKLVLLCSIPNWARPLVSSVLRFAGRVRHSTLINLTRDGGLSTREYHEVIADTLHLVKEMSEFMEDYDALIFPPHALPALEHRGCVELVSPPTIYLRSLGGLFGRLL
jgi:fatty acid amide hydrolase